MTQDIIIPYIRRAPFSDYHLSQKRFAVTVAHRRAGKTVARINKLIKGAAACKKLNPRFGYLAPYYVQAKDIAWQYLKHYSAPITGLSGGKVNESELSVTFPHNGAVIKLYGAENAERIRGTYFDGLTIDEAQHIASSVLTTIILPALSDRQGWLDVSGTAHGWGNLLGAVYKLALANKGDWFVQMLKASETGILPTTELEHLKKMMPENEYLQEFECSFDAAITGAVYGKWISELENKGRCYPGIFDKDLPVHTAWDLGYDDATSIWFWQILRGELRLIDYYENNGQDIEHYCDIIRKKEYVYGKHYVPHDAANKLLAAGGRSIVQQAYAFGIKMFVVAATTQQNGIEAARKSLECTWVDSEKCSEGIEALKQYQFEFDDDKKVFRSKPRHDWSSHAADAYEIIGQVWKNPVMDEDKPKPKFLHDLTAKDVFWPQEPTSPKRERI